MIAACLAYLWIIFLGLTALREDWVRLIHRADRCDWSLFHLGLALLDYFLNEELSICSSFGAKKCGNNYFLGYGYEALLSYPSPKKCFKDLANEFVCTQVRYSPVV